MRWSPGTRLAFVAVLFAAVALACAVLAIVTVLWVDDGASFMLLLTLLLALLVIGMAGSLWRLRMAMASAEEAVAALRRFEAGDLAHRLPPSQGISVAFNRAAEAMLRTTNDLEGERDKLTTVLDTMADGVVVLDHADVVTLTNAAARALLGGAVTAERRLRDHELQQLVRLCREMGSRQHREVQLVRGRRTLSAIGTPVRDGGRVEVLLTLHDLTPMRLIETTRREFVTNVSHELRSPLASVKAMVETLENGMLDERARAEDFLARIHREVDRMHSMVNELLELARMESGQAELARAPLDLGILLQETAEDMQSRAQAKGITLHVARAAELPEVLGDAGKLRQVVVNFVDNALKFTPDGGTVTLRADFGDEPMTVRVAVEDTGPGIPAEHLPHVLERFYKADRSRRDAGTGLGLSIANHIVRAHGGSISVRSTEGEGATFAFTLAVDSESAAVKP